MKTASLTIGAPRAQRNPQNVYVLQVKYMHGDADAYTSESHRFAVTRIEELKKTVLLINAAGSYEFDTRGTHEGMVSFLSEKTGLSADDAEVFLDNFGE